jgi:DNA-binding transcriptional MocR family regulator
MNAQELADELNRTFSLEHGISVKALERALNEAEQRGYAEGRLDGALNCDKHCDKAKQRAYEDAAKIAEDFKETMFVSEGGLPDLDFAVKVRKHHRRQIADAIRARAKQVGEESK